MKGPGTPRNDSVSGVGSFTTTHWSVVLTARDGDTTQADAALEKLCRTYWPPLYAYIRRDGYSMEDGQDLTQEFFGSFLKKKWLGHLQHREGKFRSFLLTFLKHFLSDQRDRADAQKRGGHCTFISLDQFAAEERDRIEPVARLTPDQVFEQQWARTLLERALRRLREEYAAKGGLELFEQLKDIQPGVHGSVNYSEIGQRLGLAEGSIKAAVHRLRKRHREILHEEIAQTVSRPDEIADEVRDLMTVVGRQSE